MLAKWLQTPLCVDTGLQSQRKLASSALTLILFQQSAPKRRSTIFVVPVGMTTAALVGKGKITSLFTHVEECPIGKVMHASFTLIPTQTHTQNVIQLLQRATKRENG